MTHDSPASLDGGLNSPAVPQPEKGGHHQTGDQLATTTEPGRSASPMTQPGSTPRKRPPLWPAHETLRLKELWSEGWTAQEISTDLGTKTRDAVIGKAHRLRLSKRPSPIHRKRREIRGCLYMEGEPSFERICGKSTKLGGSWCPEHERIVFNRQPSKLDKFLRWNWKRAA